MTEREGASWLWGSILCAFLVWVLCSGCERTAHTREADKHISQTWMERYQDTKKYEIPDEESDEWSMVPVAERTKWRKLRAIMSCESGSRWVAVRVPNRGHDVGPCQINTFWHAERAKAMGYDIWQPTDNMLYCISLYETEGERPRGQTPWEATRQCWEHKMREYAKYDAARQMAGAETIVYR